MTVSDLFVSVVAPLRNAADTVVPFAEETLEVLRGSYANYELVLVDDGSTDATVERVAELLGCNPCVRLLRLSKEFGTEVAISAGLDSVIGDFTVVMLPETDPPQLIPGLVTRARAGHGVLFGVCHDRGAQPSAYRFATRLFYWLATRVLRLPLTPDATYFRVLSRQAVNAITASRNSQRFLRLESASVGYGAVPFEYAPVRRRAGHRAMGLGEALETALALVTSATSHPLRLMSWLALGSAVLNLLYAGYVMALYVSGRRLQEGWVTLSLQSAGMFFLVCVILAMLCEYTGRILEETRKRPLYHLLEERNSSVMIADATRRNVVRDSPDVTP